MVRKANPALLKPMNLSDELEAVVGKGPLPRSQVVKKLWEYIKKHKLQDPKAKRMINPDDKLSKVLGTRTQIDMFQMTKKVSGHIT